MANVTACSAKMMATSPISARMQLSMAPMDMAKAIVQAESDYTPEEIQKEAEAILGDSERKALFEVACT